MSRLHVNGILETSIYVDSPTRSVEFYRRIFGFEPIAPDPHEINDDTRLCALRAGDRSVLLLKATRTPPAQSTSPSASRGPISMHGSHGWRSKASPSKSERLGTTAAKPSTSAIPTATC